MTLENVHDQSLLKNVVIEAATAVVPRPICLGDTIGPFGNFQRAISYFKGSLIHDI